ncbi:MAG: sigma-70 family RNA polymerase sigma factor [Candidatus Omnitrophota bacterium]|nr:sigma-70 family RNA polymerase sigma factor [Candidatus Omnitrophota bacterium]
MKAGDNGRDEKLIDACLKRDAAAWALFVEKYSGLVSTSITNRLKKYGLALAHQEIEDIRQDVFTSIWSGDKLGSVKNRKAISYWLSIVSGNTALEYMRSKLRKEPVKPLSISDKIGETELAGLIPSSGPSPYKKLEIDTIVSGIESAIESLGGKDRLIMKLNILYDKKHEEIAEILNIPAGTVSCYIKRSKEILRRKLRDLME